MQWMADPARGTLIEILRRDQLHSRDIAAALEYLRETLSSEGIPFGLIGALALRYHGYERFTEDIDILTTGEGLERIHERLVGKGIVPRSQGLRKKLRLTRFRVNLDVVTAGEHAGSRESPTVFPDPLSECFLEEGGLRVATIDTLVALKISSGVWGRRDQDLVDVQKVIRANGLTEEFAERLPPPLRVKYLELLERSRLERELEE